MSLISKQKNSDGSRDKISSWNLSPYCSLTRGKNVWEAFYAYSRYNITSERSLLYGNTLMLAQARYLHHKHMVDVYYSRNIDFAREFTFVPKVTVRYTLNKNISYQEYGALTALNVLVKQPRNAFELAAGFNLVQRPLGLRAYNLRTEFTCMGVYYPGNIKTTVVANFIAGGNAFDFHSVAPRFALRAGLSMTYVMHNDVDIKLGYSFKAAPKYIEHSVLAEVRYLF
jgi:uncharacterized protein with beta-barrel porin domain